MIKMKKPKQVKSTGCRKKGGTHGSVSKAGKMRDQNRVRWDLRERKSKKSGLNLKHIKKHDCPKVSNRKRYKRMVNKPKKRFESIRRMF